MSSLPSPSASATIGDVRLAIDKALREKGGAHATYSCKSVSWDDVARGSVGTSLSCWGSNITDTYLKSKSGQPLFTLRPDNWNEKLGVVCASDVALLVGNVDNPPSSLRNITLQQFLDVPAQFTAAYNSLDSSLSLYDADADKKVSIRFQTVFLPVQSSHDSSSKQTFQFAAEAYSYNTKSDSDPRNLVLLATSQGIALQADGVGAKRLLHHAVQSDASIMQHWLEAERSDHSVGGPQKESSQEREDALKRGKATAEVIGIKAMGTRFNSLITIQIPLQQQARYAKIQSGSIPFLTSGDGPLFDGGLAFSSIPSYAQPTFGGGASFGGASLFGGGSSLGGGPPLSYPRSCKRARGQANAARVSRGDVYGKFFGLSVKSPERNKQEHVTVTVVFYNTVAGGVPSAEDAIAAVSDMEALYEACTQSGRLGDAAFDFMKHELTAEDGAKIAGKIVTQPVVVSNPPEAMADKVYDGAVKSLLKKKFVELGEDMSSEKVVELELLVFGSFDGEQEIRDVLKRKFTDLRNSVTSGQSLAASQLLQEIKLIVKLKGIMA